MRQRKSEIDKQLDVLQRLNIVRDDQKSKLAELMAWSCDKDARHAIRDLIDLVWFERIGQYKDEDIVSG